ncbi:hypothetical protein C7974DRAFT_374552 [Boeremia exigua]|uniref:uncharacterized protein n=1 Tax=Boeremia exigua TaxID=749465 RepID=UPI001E8DF8DC|nr:uncharacterized protein C7974DRAFT_374552 [Boeremia exigua]KAH6637932.1 hypothetical protein C7974DRAFT_374552 [Boeremia exigua]
MDLEAITSRNQTESPLLRIPPEIRNCIFRYALTCDGVVNIYPNQQGIVYCSQSHPNYHEGKCPCCRHVPHGSREPDRILQLVCSQIRWEIGYTYFLVNTFQFRACYNTLFDSACLRLPCLDVLSVVLVEISALDVELGEDIEGDCLEECFLDDVVWHQLQIVKALRGPTRVDVKFIDYSLAKNGSKEELAAVELKVKGVLSDRDVRFIVEE